MNQNSTPALFALVAALGIGGAWAVGGNDSNTASPSNPVAVPQAPMTVNDAQDVVLDRILTVQNEQTKLFKKIVEEQTLSKDHDAAVHRQISDVSAQIKVIKEQMDKDRARVDQAAKWQQYWAPRLEGRQSSYKSSGKPLTEPLVVNWGTPVCGMDWCKSCARRGILTDVEVATEDLP